MRVGPSASRGDRHDIRNCQGPDDADVRRPGRARLHSSAACYLPAAWTDDRARCREAGGDGRSRPTMSALPSACPKLCLVQGGTQGRETERGKNGACRTDGGPQVPT